MAALVVASGQSMRYGMSGEGRPNPPMTLEAVADQSAETKIVADAVAAYEAVHMDTADKPLLLVHDIAEPDTVRERILEHAMESTSIPSLFLGRDLVLGSYAFGVTDGIVFDVSAKRIRAVGIDDGFPMMHTYEESPIGGLFASKLLQRRLEDRSLSVSLDICDLLKIQNAYVPIDFLDDSARDRQRPLSDTNIVLPDGRRINFGDDFAVLGESLLYPAVGNSAHTGLIDLLEDVVKVCKCVKKPSVQAASSSIVGIGGGSQLPGLGPRVRLELLKRELVPERSSVNCATSPDRAHASWIGGSLLASLPEFVSTFFVDRQEYAEHGASIIYDKCA